MEVNDIVLAYIKKKNEIKNLSDCLIKLEATDKN